MTQPTYVTIGELTLDDTVLESGELRRNQSGGGALYSALGIHLWGSSVGINAVVGHDYPQAHLDTLVGHQIDLDGVLRWTGWGLRLWLLHEENNKKQQVFKLQSSTFEEMDRLRPDLPPTYQRAKAYHLAPASPAGQQRSRDAIRLSRPDALISLDILTDPYIDLESYRSGTALQGIDIFLPSSLEVDILWPGIMPSELLPQLARWGPRWIALKQDERGSIVYDANVEALYKIPICPVNAIDTTGAGDVYCGAFLVGLAETGDVVEAGIRATVAASFAVERWGALDLLQVPSRDVEVRLAWLRSQVSQLSLI